MDKESLKKELENKKKQNRLTQKKAMIVFFVIAVIFAVAYAVITIAESGWFFGEEEITPEGYEFYPVQDYEYDIMTNSAYLALLKRPLISLSDGATGVTDSLDPEEYDKKGDAVALLTKLVIAIQQGDAETYNSCFSEKYTAVSGTKYRFTMQQVYDVIITKYSEVKTGSKVTATYGLKYKIRQNNGSLRLDMGSDCYREQIIVMTDDNTAKELKIDSVTTSTSEPTTRTVTYGWRIAAVAVGAVITVGGVCVLAVFCVRKLVKKNDLEISDEEASGN